MDHADETDPIIPDPPFSITLEKAGYSNVLVMPGWNHDRDGAEFEIYAGETSIGKIRRNPYDIEGWQAIDGVLTLNEVDEIGHLIDNHYS